MNIYLLVSKEYHREYFSWLLSLWSEYSELDEFQEKQRSKLLLIVAAIECISLCVISDCNFKISVYTVSNNVRVSAKQSKTKG